MSHPLHLAFLGAAVDVAKLPASRAEVAFIGRSNVGKSSLLNALAGQKELAPVSKSPGRTKALGCFALDRSTRTLVDCPGYGYAKVPKATRATWLPMLERYLLDREPLALVLLLVDGEIGPTESDLYMLDWLRGNDLPHAVVATKRDKVKPSQRDKREREVAAACQLPPDDIVWVSASENFGIGRLRQLVRESLV